jgi:proteic killer suppression protein
MEITFKTKKFQKICNSDVELQKAYGKNCAKRIRSRLDDLQASHNLEVLRGLPGRCHELKGNRKNQLSLDLEHPYRLIFEPSNPDVQRKVDGGLDWNLINSIEIIGVEDTHDGTK